MSKKEVTIKEVALNNNCPECFSKEGLTLTFKQQFIETKIFKALTQDISTTMYCNICNNNIYPVNWTEDIERVYNYQIKAFTPKEASKKFKPLFWIITGAISALIITTAILIILTYFPELL